MFHYAHHLIGEDFVGKDVFCPFLLAQCNGLICSSVVRSKEYFSPDYLARIENILVVSSAFLEKKSFTLLERADTVVQNKYLRILDSLLCLVNL